MHYYSNAYCTSFLKLLLLNTHTHAFVCVNCGDHRLLLLLYLPNNIFYPLTLILPLTENMFAFLHFQINIIYNFLSFFFPLVVTAGRSEQSQTFQALLSLWEQLVPSM